LKFKKIIANFKKFIVSVWGGHYGYSLWAPKNRTTSLVTTAVFLGHSLRRRHHQIE